MATLHIITTKDGSTSLWNEQLDETYHSRHGAITESKHVFIQYGLLPLLPKHSPLQLLEVGFGTGLNALLTLEMAMKFPHTEIYYTALEPYPISLSLIEQLNYANSDPLKSSFLSLHNAPWEISERILPNFYLLKLKTRLEDVILQPDFYHVVYFDAFAPSKQPEMWHVSQFEKLFSVLRGGGVLVTYCAKGAFKRALKQVGFYVETLPGPPGKREMTRGLKR